MHIRQLSLLLTSSMLASACATALKESKLDSGLTALNNSTLLYRATNALGLLPPMNAICIEVSGSSLTNKLEVSNVADA